MSLEVNVCTLHPKLNGNGFWYCIISSDWNRDIGILKNVISMANYIANDKNIKFVSLIPPIEGLCEDDLISDSNDYSRLNDNQINIFLKYLDALLMKNNLDS